MPDPLDKYRQQTGGGTATVNPPAKPAASSFSYTKGPGQRDADELRAQGYITNPLRPDTELVKPGTWEVYRVTTSGFYSPTSPISSFGTGAAERLQIQAAISQANRGAVPPIGAPTPRGAPANSLATTGLKMLNPNDVSNVLNRELASPRSRYAGTFWNPTPGAFKDIPAAGVPDWVGPTGFDPSGSFRPFEMTTAAALPPIQISGPQSFQVAPQQFGDTSIGFGANSARILADTGHPSSGNPAVDALAAYVIAQSTGSMPDWSQSSGPSGLAAMPAPAPEVPINAPITGSGGYSTAAATPPTPEEADMIGGFLGDVRSMVGLAGGGTVLTTNPAAIVDMKTGQPLAMTSEYGQPELARINANGIQITPMGRPGMPMPMPPPLFGPGQPEAAPPAGPGAEAPPMLLPPLVLPRLQPNGSPTMTQPTTPPMMAPLDPMAALNNLNEERQRSIAGGRWARAGLPQPMVLNLAQGQSAPALPPGIYARTAEQQALNTQANQQARLQAEIAAMGDPGQIDVNEVARLQAALQGLFRGGFSTGGGPGNPYYGTADQINQRLEAIQQQQQAIDRIAQLQWQLRNLGY